MDDGDNCDHFKWLHDSKLLKKTFDKSKDICVIYALIMRFWRFSFMRMLVCAIITLGRRCNIILVEITTEMWILIKKNKGKVENFTILSSDFMAL